MTNDLRGALERLTNVADSVVTQHATSSVRPGSMVVLADAVTIARQALSAPVGDGRLGPAALHAEAEGGREPAGLISEPAFERALAIFKRQARDFIEPEIGWSTETIAENAVYLIRDALSQPSPDGGGERPTAAIENLTNCQRQLDMDGCHVGVSRQALVEVLAYVAALPPLASGEGKGRRADKDALASASARTVEPTSSGSEGGG